MRMVERPDQPAPPIHAAGPAHDPILQRHRDIWERRPLLRRIYRDLYGRMTSWLSRGLGPTVELGGGSGNFKEFSPNCLSSDISWSPWLDLVADGTRLPFRDAAIGNIVMFDVFHHLPYPAKALREAQRVLAVGGRMILCEPYVSWTSGVVYRLLHPEPTDTRVRPLDYPDEQPVFDFTGAWSSNQAIPTVLFWRDRRRLATRFPKLMIRHRQALSTFVYPLSGGFEKPCLLPRFSWPLAWAIERATSPFARWIGFRCLVVIERIP
jgi:SAM-dependent methyltransferase